MRYPFETKVLSGIHLSMGTLGTRAFNLIYLIAPLARREGKTLKGDS
jgi:hypothetical protein